MKAIVYKTQTGGVGVIYPAPDYMAERMASVIDERLSEQEKEQVVLEELAAKDVPLMNQFDLQSPQCPWRIVDSNILPSSRNWRDAWTDENPGESVDVDFEKAKNCHYDLIVRMGYQRIEKDAFGNQDFTLVASQLASLNIHSLENFEALYNAWPACIEQREQARTYHMHGEQAPA